MYATISIVCHNKSDVTRECIKSLENFSNRDDVEYILSDNASSDDTVSVFMNSKLKNKVLVRYGVNTGFGYPHNMALKIAKGKFFIILNNDIILHQTNWLDTILSPLMDKDVALVGMSGTPCTLKPDGNGFIGSVVDYIEGSCMAARTELLKEYGLFSPSIKKYYFEDSDASLRYRQMGYKLEHIPINHTHIRGATARIVRDDNKDKIIRHNQTIFMNRWAKYLQMRDFSNRILVKIPSIGAGDVVALTPILEGLRLDHPTAKIEIDTRFPDIFKYNPYVEACFPIARKHTESYDRVINLTPTFQSLELIARQGERIASTKVKSYLPQIYYQQFELDAMANIINEMRSNKEVIVGVNLQMHRQGWEGRNWNLENAIKFIDMLSSVSDKIGIIEIGNGTFSTGRSHVDLVNKTELREMFAIIPQLDFFVGIDSLPFHVAQAHGVKSFVLFGATEPISRIVDFNTVVPIRRGDLACIGCYHKTGALAINKCGMKNEACMNGLKPEKVMEYILEEVDSAAVSIDYLQRFLRRDDVA